MEKMEIQPMIRRSAIIGVGTSGLLSVLYTKKTLEQYYGQIPMAVRFLVLDTTQNWERGVRFIDKEGIGWRDMVIEPHEFFYMGVPDPTGVIKTSSSIQRWWPEGFPTKTVLHGAGQMRALGRLALHAHASSVVKKLEDLLTPLTDMGLGSRMQREQGLRLNLGLAEIDIYIVGSLAGGTGGGCFIDLAFMLRELSRTQLSKICGYFILPWIFKGLPATDWVNSNAYAALRELDHYMSLDYI